MLASTIDPKFAYDLSMRVVSRLRNLGIALMPLSPKNLQPGQRPGMEYFIYPATGIVALHLRPAETQSVNRLLREKNNIQLAAGVEAGRIYLNNDFAVQAVVCELFVAQPPTLWLSSMMDSVEPFHMILGKKMDGSPLRINLNSSATPHLLIAGATGSGKTAAAHAALASVCLGTPRMRVLAYDRTHAGLPWLMPMIRNNIWEIIERPEQMV